MAVKKKIAIEISAKGEGAVQALEKLAQAARNAQQEVNALGGGKGKGGGKGMGLADVYAGMMMFKGGALAVAGAIDKTAEAAFNQNNLMKNLPFSIDAAKRSTDGLVASSTLMQQAIKANRMGVAQSSGEFAKFAEMASKLGMTIGMDTTEAMERFTTALGRGSPQLLDDFGILMDLEQVHKDYAKAIGKTVSELTELDKKQAIQNEAMRQGREILKGIAVDTESTAAKWVKLKTAMGDSFKEAAVTTFDALDAMANNSGPLSVGAANAERMRLRFEGMKAGTLDLAKAADQLRGQLVGLGNTMAAMPALGLLSSAKEATDASLRSWVLSSTQAGIHSSNVAARNAQNILDKRFKGGGGSKVDPFFGAKDEWLAQQMGTRTMQRGEGDPRMAAGMAGDASRQRDMMASVASMNQQIVAAERQKQDLLLEERMRGLEIARAEGLDPEVAAMREIEIQEQSLERHRELVESRLTGEQQLSEMEGIRSQQEQLRHEKRLLQIKQELAAEQKRKAVIAAVGNAVASTFEGTARAALMAAIVQKSSAREAVKGFATAGALEMGLTATMELIRAAVAAASFNYPKAAQHTANAAAAGVQAGILGAIAGAASIGGGGRGGSGGGFGGSAFGGPGMGGGSSGGQSERSGGWNQPKPISRTGGGWGAPAGGGGNSGGGNIHVSIGTIQSLGKIDEDELLHTLNKKLAQNKRNMGT